ncbi:MAG TPA: serine hydrolase domain-containing protein [Gemmatimonadaceae bacterium]|nr:serine hydrolase domain-containing protein [Gemmatimonadaceae bacterium]
MHLAHRWLTYAGSAALLITIAAAGCGDDSGSRVTGLSGRATSLNEFERRLDTLRMMLKIPGMSATIAANGRIAWQKAYGLADVGGAVAVADTTSFHLASLTKMMAAVVLLRLVDSGLVSLDDPVSKYGVTVTSGGTVRVRHLLTMTSGGATPGESFSYNGDAFGLLDEVIRRSAGRPFADLANAWIIEPLGLEHTAPNVDDQTAFAFTRRDAGVFRANMAKPYTLSGGSVVPSRYPGYFGTAAGMIASATDVARFSLALDAGTLLRAAMRDSMYTPPRTSNGTALPYALGCFSQMYNGVRIVWGYGLWTAISSLLVKVPDRGITFVVLANTEELSRNYGLGAGKLLDSPVAREFLNAFVFGDARLP